MFFSQKSHCVDGSILNNQVMRQTKFTEKMRQLGWLNPKFFDNSDNAKTLEDCIMRYYGWVLLRRPVVYPDLI